MAGNLKAASLTTWERNPRRFLDSVLLGDTAAGVLLSGDSGTGKSNAMQVLAQHLIQTGSGLTLLDPHDELGSDLEQYCAALPPSRRRKVIVIRYSDTSRIVGLNPLFVDPTGLDNLTRLARIASRVSHTGKIILHAFGERDFHGKPILMKWFFRYLTTLARAGMTIPDVRYFFDVKNEVYRALINVAADFIAQLEMEQLAELRPAEREEQIGSTKNRFLNFLENPIVELALSKPDGHLNLQQAIRDRAIIIISLGRGGVLRDEDVEIFSNLWLQEILYAIYNTPRSERVPHFLLIDELPTFRSSFEVITTALAQVRKFLCRFVVAFQGSQLFEERERDRLLNALVGQCNVHFYFRHKNPVDARFFGEIVKLPSIQTTKVKHILRQKQQYQDGHDLVILTDTSENSSHATQDGGSSAQATSDSHTDTHGRAQGGSQSRSATEATDRLAEVVTRARAEQSSASSSQSTARGTTQTEGSSWSKTKTQGSGITRKQTLVPRIRTREVVTGVQFYSTEEQFTEKASELTRLQRGQCLLYLAGQGVCKVQVP